ncbi:hypothetical protein CFIICLFH_0274 [Methylobacterium goesingense]|nr:hypothetical protein CFIICLFH_0274 [Methylobacterium goesingense]
MVPSRMPMAIHPFHARTCDGYCPVVDLMLCGVLAISLLCLLFLTL